MDIDRIKPSTLTHYELLTLGAIRTVAGSIAEALDLNALASQACMAPLHFHRVFRGLVGETALQLHRRLRLEHAAWRLASQTESVLRIALDAGYETHESFTRAFGAAFGRSPTEHRALAQPQDPKAGQRGQRAPVHGRLQAACGIHADAPTVIFPDNLASLFTHHGAADMNVQIEDRPALRVAVLTHTGPYNTIGAAFERLGSIAGPAGLFADGQAKMIAIYHDDPESVAAGQLRSAAGVTIRPGVAIPPGLQEVCIPAGRWAYTEHRGSYSGLGDAWQRLLGQWLPHSGEQLGAGDGYELYVNHPGQASEADLRTRLYLPLKSRS